MFNVVKAIMLTALYDRWRSRWQMRDTLDRRAWYALHKQHVLDRAMLGEY